MRKLLNCISENSVEKWHMSHGRNYLILMVTLGLGYD